jgi:polysaccharide biosynthesis transport protein
MSEPKITFHAPVSRGQSSAQEIVAVPSGNVSVRRKPSGSRPVAAPNQAMNSQIALNALRRWWMISLPVGLLLAAAAVGAVYWHFEPQYEAAALLEIAETSPFVAFEPKEPGVSKAFFRTQIEIIRSRWIMGRTVASENVKELPEIRKQLDPIDWLRKRVSVVSPNDSNVFEIKYSSPDPENAALVANEVTRQYQEAQTEEEAQRSREILKALNKQLTSRLDDVKALRRQVEAAMEKMPGDDQPDPGTQSDLRPGTKNPLTELQSRLIDVQVERAILSARIKAVEEELRAAEQAASSQRDAAAKAASVAPAKKGKRELSQEEVEVRDEMVERALDNAPEVRQAESQLLAGQMELERTEKRLKQGKKDVMYIRRQEELAIAEHGLAELKKKLMPGVEKEVEFLLRTKQGESGGALDGGFAPLARRRDELARLRVELKSKEFAEENLRKDYSTRLANHLKQREQISGESMNLRFKKDELHEAQEVMAKINDRLVALQTEQSAPRRVIWHEEAKAPQVPMEMLPYRNMFIVGLAAFCVPFALAVVWEIRARRIGSPEDLEQHVHLAVLGEIARLPTRSHASPRSERARIGAELRVFEESVDSLRTALTLSDDLRNMRILAITSAANHEGKTSVASQLALSLARATGKSTLLIDGDMRSPDVHQVFGVARGPGLAEVLSDEITLAEAIVPTHNPSVQLLPAGRLKVSPHRLLGNGAWKSLLAQIPSSYGYVVIDTPPVLAASEALVLAKSADAVLICVMRDVSRADQVCKASNLLQAAGGCPVGTVLNGVPIRRYRYYYGSYPSQPTAT